MPHRPTGLFVLSPDAYDLAYGPAERADVAALADVVAPALTPEQALARPDLLARADVLFSGWGPPLVDEVFLDLAPRLTTVFYAAGATGSWMTEAAWDRGLVVTTASAANAVPVAEYTLAAILFSLKHGWRLARQARADRTYANRGGVPGNYRSGVGLIALGTIGRTLLPLLRPFDLDVFVYDPFLTDAEAAALRVTRLPLAELFARCDVVSLHAPELPETRHLVTGELLASMRPGATFINTARGSVVDESALCRVLADRPDLQAVLDTTAVEPPPADSPLYALDNVVLTPHVAGSIGPECRRMGRMMVDELQRFVAGQPLLHALTRDATRLTAHRPHQSGRRPVMPPP